jgi:pyrimidine 5'-nucleotidase
VTITTLFFDLDDTLYPASSGLWGQIRQRIGMYMRERLEIPSGQVDGLRRQLFEEYGTTLRGLQVNYAVDTADFLAYVHDVPLTDYISPAPQLGALIHSLPQRKFIFTNADRLHAGRVLRVLGLEDCFEGIIDVVAMDPYCKPMPQSFEIALRTAGNLEPGECALIDDIRRTTRAARQVGMLAILFGAAEMHADEADASLTDWLELPGVLMRRK